jgi:iron complex transport system substrate-binding protein|tara:strand:- start:3555 stop:4562 length:1008 start_codon:yes stop_codon:yes gene_type:complete
MSKKISIYLFGVLLGILILKLIPRKEPREPHPWHNQTAPESSYPRAVEDDLGRTVTLEVQPRWVVSLAPSITETLFAMEMGDHLSGVTRWDVYPEKALLLRDAGFSVGDMDAPDIERIHTLPLDLVLGSKLTPQHIYEKISGVRGVPALAIDASSLDDYLDEDLPLLGAVLGVPSKVLTFKTSLVNRRAAVAEMVERHLDSSPKRVALLLSLEETFQPGWSPGSATWLGALIDEAHGENVAAELGKQWGVFPLESLLEADPEVFLIKDGESEEHSEALRERIASLKTHPVWQHMSAVKNDRIVLLEPGPLSIPGPRMVDALEAIAGALWLETPSE